MADEPVATSLNIDTAAQKIASFFSTPNTEKKPEEPATPAAPPVTEEAPPAPETPTGEDEIPPGDEPAGDKSEGDENDDKGTEHPPLYTVKVDGAEQQVTLEEALAGYSRTEHFTKKSQKLAEETKAAEAERVKQSAEIAQRREDLDRRLEATGAILQGLLPPEPNWDELRGKFSKEDVDAAYVSFKDQESRIRKIAEQRAEIAKERDAGLQKQAEEYERVQNEKLTELVPEWKDPERKTKDLEGLKVYGRSQGFSDDELRSVVDARLLNTLRKAAAFDRLQAAKPKVENTIKNATPGATPGNGQGRPPASTTTRAKQRLAKTGSREDATAVFAEMLTRR